MWRASAPTKSSCQTHDSDVRGHLINLKRQDSIACQGGCFTWLVARQPYVVHTIFVFNDSLSEVKMDSQTDGVGGHKTMLIHAWIKSMPQTIVL